MLYLIAMAPITGAIIDFIAKTANDLTNQLFNRAHHTFTGQINYKYLEHYTYQAIQKNHES